VAEGLSMAIQSGWLVGAGLCAAGDLSDRALAGARAAYARAWRANFAARVRASSTFAALTLAPASRGRQRRGAALHAPRAHLGRALRRQGIEPRHPGGIPMTTLERLQAMLARDFELDPAVLTSEATLEGLEIDSLRLIEIFFSIEEAFGITVSAEQSEIRARVRTLGDLAGYVDELVAAKAGTAD
jgi:acyl carrier protein